MIVEVNNKKYDVKEAITDEEKEKGLSGIDNLPEDKGMIFIFDPPQDVGFWMKDTKIPLDIVFINDDEEVVKVAEGKSNDETLIEASDIAYVLEVNTNSGINVGDEVDFEDDEPIMKVLASDGSDLYFLWGGERIVSRRETKILIKKAKKAQNSNKESDYKALGKYIFKVLNGQDNRDPEYVDLKE